MKKLLLLLTLLLPLNVLAGTLTFTADAATKRLNGDAMGLSEIDKYEAICGTAPGDYTALSAFTTSPIVLTKNVWKKLNVPSSKYYCVLYTYDIDGRKSWPSPEIFADVPVSLPGYPVNVIINFTENTVTLTVEPTPIGDASGAPQ